MNLKFHWMLPKGGEVVVNGTQTAGEATRYRIESHGPSSPAAQPDIPGWLHFVNKAEQAGIDSVLISFSRREPDPMLVATTLGMATEKLKFIIALRSGLVKPAALVQQINTLSALTHGRVSLNIVAGSSQEEQQGYGDFLNHDERYARAGEFLGVCHAFWQADGEVNFSGNFYRVAKGELSTSFVSPERQSPEIFISGHSQAAKELVVAQGSCWLRAIDTPEKLAPKVAQMKALGIEVGLRLGIICRPTREQAIEVIEGISRYTHDKQRLAQMPARADSQMFREGMAVAKDAWLSDTIWAGFVPVCNPVWTTLVGTPEQLTEAFMAYKRIGVSQFIISGWPEVDEVEIFGKELLPRIRAAEALAEYEPA